MGCPLSVFDLASSRLWFGRSSFFVMGSSLPQHVIPRSHRTHATAPADRDRAPRLPRALRAAYGALAQQVIRRSEAHTIIRRPAPHKRAFFFLSLHLNTSRRGPRSSLLALALRGKRQTRRLCLPSGSDGEATARRDLRGPKSTAKPARPLHLARSRCARACCAPGRSAAGP